MPGYSEKAPQYPEPLAQAVLVFSEVRDWLLSGTKVFPRRAACLAKPNKTRKSHVPHEDWVTVPARGHSLLSGDRVGFFDRVVAHKECMTRIAGWPDAGSDLASRILLE